ncbi:MAG: glycoside hydrolase family 1 protein [Deltaproteobacteria bacterium]|nr:glycoside hydrolase family 1 protein [Deltaproteobacteria bacterium]
MNLLIACACLFASVVVFADLFSRLPKRKGIHSFGGNGPFAFPPGFFWGAATSDHQIERAQNDDWTHFERKVHKEGKQDRRADGNVTAGHIAGFGKIPVEWIDTKCDFDTHFASDLAACKGMGHNAHRFSISWARLFPRAGMTEADPAGVAFYAAIFDELEKNGLQPFVTLFHFASPQWLWEGADKAGKRGLEREDAIEAFAIFTRAVVKNFGSRIKFWCTLNEPMVWAYLGYLDGMFPPGEKRAGGPKEVFDVVAQLLRMHAAAWKEIKAGDVLAQVGIAHHIRHFIPWRKWWPFDGLTALLVDQAFMLDFTDAIETGTLSGTLTGRSVTIPGLAGTYDYVGLNYYGRFYVKAVLPGGFTIIPHDENEPGEEKNDLGWAIDETSFTPELVRFYKRYRKPLYILENGIADNHDDDVRRQNFIVRHARAMWQAIEDGADVRGFFFWSLVDNFEWAEGFDPRFGLLKVDYTKGGARTPRPSADVYRQIASSNGIPVSLWTRLRRR